MTTSLTRRELFEFEDWPGLPSAIRSGVTNLIRVFHRLTGTAEVLCLLLEDVHEVVEYDRITDLGSGSGGPMIAAINCLNAGSRRAAVQLLLTDLHPDPAVLRRINAGAYRNVTYHPAPVDAGKLREGPGGLKTMVASFHHMPPPVAGSILRSAQDSGEPILIYELAENKLSFWLWCLLLPFSLLLLFLMALVMMPFTKGLRAEHILFTYLIPVIPLIYAWDGQASLMRTYTEADIRALLPPPNGKYRWKITAAETREGRKAGYYVLGYVEPSTE